MQAPTYRNSYVSEVAQDGTITLMTDIDFATSHEVVYNREQQICALNGVALKSLSSDDQVLLMSIIGSWSEWKKAIPGLVVEWRKRNADYCRAANARTQHSDEGTGDMPGRY